MDDTFIIGTPKQRQKKKKKIKGSSKPSSGIINFYDKIEDTTEYFNPNPNMPKHPFRASLVGQSGSGKTNLLMNLIANCGCFEKFVICTKLIDEPLYDYLKKSVEAVDKERIIMIDKVEDLPSIEAIENKKKGGSKDDKKDSSLQTLIVFDDMCLEHRKLQEIMSQFFIRGRKSNMSVIYISQSYYLIPKCIRLQCTHLMLKKIGSKREINSIVNDYNLDISTDDLMDIYNDATEDMTSFLMIDVTENDHNQKFRKNFERNPEK